MKKALLLLCLVTNVHAMESEKELDTIVEIDSLRAPSDEIAANLVQLIKQYGKDLTRNNEQFHQLVVQYFKKESMTIESNIMPHLEKKLRDSDSDIQEILEKDDRDKLAKLIHDLVTESIEEAFKEKEVQYDELRQLADIRLKRARYGIIAAIASGVLGALSVFLGAYFGRA